MKAVPPSSIILSPLGHSDHYLSDNQVEVFDVSGNAVALLTMVSPLYVNRCMAALKQSTTMPLADRIQTIIKAADIFCQKEINNNTLEQHELLVSRVSGVPLSVVREATDILYKRLSNIFKTIESARPHGAVSDWKNPLTLSGQGVWTRKGNVLAVHAVGNHPSTHTLWPEALALGYKVAIRPSKREPFTPYRLVAALRAAGFGPDQVVLLPSESQAAETMFQAADLAYGGDEIIRKHTSNKKVYALQPGRSKILITADTDWRVSLDIIASSICHHGGMGCVNTTAILIEDSTDELAIELKKHLEKLPSHPVDHDKAVLPVQNTENSQMLAKYVSTKASGCKAYLSSQHMLYPLADNSVVVRPTLHAVQTATAEQLSVELPFPCVWLAPWTRQCGIDPLRNTLALTAMTKDESLVNQLIEEPSISNVYVGNHPTHWTDIGMPHDGYLAEFLMRTKTVIRH